MATYPLGKYKFHTLDFSYKGQPAYCIAFREYYCEVEEEGEKCTIEQLTATDNFHITVITAKGTYQDTIAFDGNTWFSLDMFDEDEDDIAEESEEYENSIETNEMVNEIAALLGEKLALL